MKKSKIALVIASFLAIAFVVGGFSATQLKYADREKQCVENELNPAESGKHYEMPQVIPTAWLRGQ